MGLSIGPTIGVDGAEKFRLAFQQMAASAGMLQSQMDAVTASFRANDSAMKTNKAVAEQLTKQIDQQQRLYDKSVEGFTKAKQATYDAAQAVAQSKKEYEAAVPVLEIFKKQHEEAVAIEQRQAAVVEDVRTKLQEATEARDALAQSLANGEAPLVNEVNLHEQLIAKGSELVNKYNEAKTAYDTFSAELAKNAEALAKAEEKHRAYSSQIDASKQRLSELKNQQAILTTAVKDSTAEFEKAKKKVEEEAEAHGYYSKEASAARAERDAYNKILKQFTTELNNVTRAINNEQKTLADLEKKDADAQKETEKLSGTVKDLTEITEVAKGELDNATDALNKEKDAAADATQKLEEYRKQNGENNKELQTANEKVDELTKTLDKEEKELSENKKETEAHTKALNGAKKEVEQYSKNIDNAEKRLDVARVTAQKWGDVMYTTKARLEELKKKLEELPKALASLGEDLINNGEAWTEYGKGLSKVLAPFTAITGFAAKGALTFTDALAKISTIADTSVVSLDEFGEGIKQLASDTGFATDDIAAAVYQALSAAVSTEDALEFTAGAADLARAGFLDMFGSVDVLTTILNAYHKDVSEVSHISDVLVKVQDRGKTTVNELAAAMGNVIPTAAQYGIKLEDLGAAYVVLTKQGINTARTTTYLRSAFTELEKTESSASVALKEATGKTFVQLLANGKSLGEIMQILKDSVKGDEEAFIHLFGSIRTAAGALALANTSAEEYAEILDDVGNSNGQAARNVEKLQTPSLKLKKIWEQLKTTGIDLGEQMIEIVLPALNDLAKSVKSFTDRMKKLSTSTKKMVASFVAIAGAIGPVTVGFGKTVIGLGKFSKALGTILGKSATFGVKLTAWASGLLALGAAFGALAIKINESAEQHKILLERQWGLSEATKENVKQSQDLIEASKRITVSAFERSKATEAETALASGLLDQLRNLYDANGKITDGNIYNAEIIKGQLADALGVEVDWIDSLIKNYGIYSKAIDDVIEKKKLEAQQEVWLEAYKEQYRAIIDMQKERNELGDGLIEQYGKWQTACADVKRAEEEAAKADEDHKVKANYMVGLAQEAQKKAYDDLSGLIEQYGKTGEAIDGARGDMELYIQKLMESSGMTEEEAKTAAQSMIDSMSEVKRENSSTIDQIILDTKDGMASFDKAVRDNGTEAFKAATSNSDNLVEGIIGGVKAFAETADQYIDGFCQRMQAKFNTNKVFGAALAVGHTALAGVETAGDTGSPSKKMARLGGFYSEGFYDGLLSWMPDIANAGTLLGTAAFPDTSWTSNYSRLPDTAYGTTNNTRNISAPIAVNVNVSGSVDDPNALADVIEQRLVEKIINNERVFA